MDPGLDVLIKTARARLENPIEGDDSIGNAEPDTDTLDLARSAPPKLRELLEIAARLWHLDLGLWEIWHGHISGVEVRGKVPDGFVASDAIKIGVPTEDKLDHILLAWNADTYGTYRWSPKSKKVEAIGNFTELLTWMARTAGEKKFKGPQVKDSMLPKLVATLGLKPFA